MESNDVSAQEEMKPATTETGVPFVDEIPTEAKLSVEKAHIEHDVVELSKCEFCYEDLEVMAGVEIASSCDHRFCKGCLSVVVKPSLITETHGLLEVKCIFNDSEIPKCEGVFSIKQFKCPICFEEVEQGDGIILDECLHTFCRNCLVKLITQAESEVKCPYIDATGRSCENCLTQTQIRYLVSAKEYETFLKRGLKLAEGAMSDAYHCKTPDCEFFLFNEDTSAQNFQCDLCQKNNCMKCKGIHELNAMCEDSSSKDANYLLSEDALQVMISAGECMKCPQCGIVVEKISGCDGLTCTTCKTDLCWATKGRRWGFEGKGDLTGGCKCNVNGVKCHPNCGNCH